MQSLHNYDILNKFKISTTPSVKFVLSKQICHLPQPREARKSVEIYNKYIYFKKVQNNKLVVITVKA